MKKFDFSLTDNTVYTGKDAEGWYSAALLSAPSVTNVTIVPNVKSSIKLAKFDLGDIIKAEGTTWSSTGEGALSQKTFTVCPKAVQVEYFRSTFEQNYLNETMKAGYSEEVQPPAFTTYILDQVAKKTSADLEVAFWQGNATGNTYPQNICDGLEFKLAADNTVVRVTGTTLTSANIIAEMGKVYSAITSQVIAKGDVKIFLPTQAVKLFKQAIAAANTITYYTTAVDLNYLGIPVVEAPGMSANKMVAAETPNLFWLTDLASDAEDVLLIPQRNISGIASLRVAANFKFGTGFMYGSEVVYYA